MMKIDKEITLNIHEEKYGIETGLTMECMKCRATVAETQPQRY